MYVGHVQARRATREGELAKSHDARWDSGDLRESKVMRQHGDQNTDGGDNQPKAGNDEKQDTDEEDTHRKPACTSRYHPTEGLDNRESITPPKG